MKNTTLTEIGVVLVFVFVIVLMGFSLVTACGGFDRQEYITVEGKYWKTVVRAEEDYHRTNVDCNSDGICRTTIETRTREVCSDTLTGLEEPVQFSERCNGRGDRVIKDTYWMIRYRLEDSADTEESLASSPHHIYSLMKRGNSYSVVLRFSAIVELLEN